MNELPSVEERLDYMVDDLARTFAKQRTKGEVFMNGSHNPLPTEIRKAQQFIARVKYMINDETFVTFCHPELDYHAMPHKGCIMR